MATFDTHAVIKDLIGTGLSEKTAEVVVQAIKNSKDIDISNLASKEQVANLASKEQVNLLEKDFEHMKGYIATKADLAEIKTELANVQATMLKWYIGTTLVVIGLLLSLKLFG